ncbi:alpha/beta hydrolase domain-containing protein [Hansschlegelia zhihuaiae]|uniref:Alpha/beta hydrolase domain-containing protein n=1 Tax=Hansschlegelia zhihuaiae TaxID=405005 RepID=A0A4Q0M3D4_9HYPH|nr:alpha/beta hydrolase domain-containing protein [Hansschlegelia zhihuaiae]RXF67428.1 hypothetical protein EK403_21380 [Hansschlegelia zhihuaiae]
MCCIVSGASGARARTARNLLLFGVAGAALFAAAPDAQARTTQITITKRAIAFGGHSFPGVGQYEVVTGIATGEVDPADARNALITDIELAPKNADGRVVYQHNFYILKPLDFSRGNGKAMYEPPNRGRKTYQALNNTPTGTDDPAAIIDADELKNSFLWPQGYTTIWSGWENALGPLDGLTATAALPVATRAEGKKITGPSYEYIVTNGAVSSFALSYPANSTSKRKATLTHRVHLNDEPEVVPSSGWSYTDDTGTAIQLTSGNFAANDIYEFSYTAKNPTVNGLGLAAIRDFVSFLRRSTVDDSGTPNPLGGKLKRIYTEVSSQPGRTLNDFTYLGFNEDEGGKKVFDGMMQWIAAGDGLNMNYRWSQTKRTNRNRQDLLYLEGLFPFANVTTRDPISKTTDGRFKRCSKTRTCPLKIDFFSSNEYWVKAASLMHTDPKGKRDLPDHPDARLYLLSSKNHGGPGDPTSKGLCQQFQNPIDSAPVQRALWQALDQWSTLGIEPPPSEIPHLGDGTLVPPLPQQAVGFPEIPGVTYTGLKTTRYRFDYGPKFYETGVPTINPPVVSTPYEDNPANGPIYPSFVPTTDSDGNEISGIRLPEVTVPLATYTGWALRAGVWANDGCEGSGQYIPFPRTAADRQAAGDPRASVEERYASYGVYRRKVTEALDNLVRRRFMLCDDAKAALPRLLQAGLDAGVPPPANPNDDASLPECRRR